MTAHVDQDLCIACGLCIQTCPNVFHWAESGKSEAIVCNVPEEDSEDAITCQESCPVNAIAVS